MAEGSIYPDSQEIMMRTLGTLALLALLTTAIPRAATADEKIGSIALFNPVQIFGEESDITGVRWNLIYGRHANIKGLDFGFIAGHVTGNFTGIQLNAINMVEGDFLGWQGGLLFSQSGGSFTGFQMAALNVGKSETEGVQFGLLNKASNMSGFQFGFVNISENMYGLQIGLVNIIKSKKKLPLLPLVNWKF